MVLVVAAVAALVLAVVGVVVDLTWLRHRVRDPAARLGIIVVAVFAAVVLLEWAVLLLAR